MSNQTRTEEQTMNDYYNWIPELGEREYEEREALMAELAEESTTPMTDAIREVAEREGRTVHNIKINRDVDYSDFLGGLVEWKRGVMERAALGEFGPVILDELPGQPVLGA
jgi:hypothetical protein